MNDNQESELSAAWREFCDALTTTQPFKAVYRAAIWILERLEGALEWMDRR